MELPAEYQDILYEDLGPVVRIWHNRPDAANAESHRLLRELDAAIARAEVDPEVRVIIFAGKGRNFSSGHDLKEAAENYRDITLEDRWRIEEKYYYAYCLRIFEMKKPTIAQVQGACIAGGFMVANMCDLIIAAEDAFFADPVTFSLGTAAIEVLIHPWVMGLRRAKEFIFTGERIGAREALQLGMVNRVLPGPELDEATLALAEKIASAPPFAMQVMKRSLNRMWEAQGLRTVLDAHFAAHQAVHETAEFRSLQASGLAAGIARAKREG